MKCINCGADLLEGALFCRKCGTAVPETLPPDRKKKREKKKATSDWASTERTKEPASTPWPGTERAKEPAASAWPVADRVKKQPEAPEPQKSQSARVTPQPAASEAQKSQPARVQPQPVVSEPAAVPSQTVPAKRQAGIRKKHLYLIAAAALILLILVIVIVAAASCKKAPAAFRTLEEVGDAVIAALNDGDGEALWKLSKLSEPVLGTHPEAFGEGESPETVMRGYYKTLADGLNARLSETYGDSYKLSGQLQTEYRTGMEIFEENRALGIEAERYAVLTGPLSVEDETVTNVRIVAVELDGEWKLLVVYLYE